MVPDEFEVRPLTSADLQRVRQLHVRPFSPISPALPTDPHYVSPPFSPSPTPPPFFYSFSSSRLAFVSAALSNAPTPRVEILTLGVLPSFQHKGLARRLISSIINSLSPDSTLVQANVAASNASALKFYERLGMRISSDIITNLYRTCSHGSKD